LLTVQLTGVVNYPVVHSLLSLNCVSTATCYIVLVTISQQISPLAEFR